MTEFPDLSFRVWLLLVVGVAIVVGHWRRRRHDYSRFL
jgi:hypothetical protein